MQGEQRRPSSVGNNDVHQDQAQERARFVPDERVRDIARALRSTPNGREFLVDLDGYNHACPREGGSEYQEYHRGENSGGRHPLQNSSIPTHLSDDRNIYGVEDDELHGQLEHS